MTFQWLLVALFLYAEIILVLLLSLRIISSATWNRLFNSRLFIVVSARSSWYFMAVIFVLILFFIDAIREINKYTGLISKGRGHSQFDAELQINMRLFRAQRNFYIVGFSLFLCFVIRRLTSLIIFEAMLMIEYEAALNQSCSSSTAATNLIDRKSTRSDQTSIDNGNKIKELRNTVLELKLKLENEKKRKEVIICQSKSISEEYVKLLKKHEILQKLIETSCVPEHQ